MQLEQFWGRKCSVGTDRHQVSNETSHHFGSNVLPHPLRTLYLQTLLWVSKPVSPLSGYETLWQMAVPRLGSKLHVSADRTSQTSREVIADGTIRPGVLWFVFSVERWGMKAVTTFLDNGNGRTPASCESEAEIQWASPTITVLHNRSIQGI